MNIYQLKESLIGKVFEHYKGEKYVISGLAIHNDARPVTDDLDGDYTVIYYNILNDKVLFTREYGEFMGRVTTSIASVQRFKEIQDN